MKKYLDEMTDEELALAYVDGNMRAFDLLLERNQSKVFSYILFLVHDEELANELFQDTFVKVISRLQNGKYINNGKFTAWCIRIAHNLIMDSFRHRQVTYAKIVQPGEDNDLSNLSGEAVNNDNAENTYVREQVMMDVKKLMLTLPTLQREVVYMRFYQQMSFKEIAAATGVCINTCLGRMRYAILNMRRMAKQYNISLDF